MYSRQLDVPTQTDRRSLHIYTQVYNYIIMEKMHETKKLIIDTAFRLFVKKGFDKTTITDIITKTKLSKGAVYHHFKSKDEIVTNAIDILWKQLRLEYDKINKEDLSALTKLQKIITTEELLLKGKEKTLITIITSSRDLKIRNQIQLANNKYFLEPIVEILKQGVKEKEFNIKDPVLTTYFIMSLQESMYLLPQDYLQNPRNLNIYAKEYTNAMARILGIDEKHFKSNYKLT